MNHTTLKTAISEAERFLDRARRAERSFQIEEWPVTAPGQPTYYSTDTTATAAVKRASMDLTRALADLRRSS